MNEYRSGDLIVAYATLITNPERADAYWYETFRLHRSSQTAFLVLKYLGSGWYNTDKGLFLGHPSVATLVLSKKRT